MFTNFEKMFTSIFEKTHFNLFHKSYPKENLLVFQPSRERSYHEFNYVTARTRKLFGNEQAPGFFTKNNNWEESSKDNFYYWHAQEKCQGPEKTSVFKKLISKPTEVFTFTEYELEEIRFRPCDCIKDTLPENFDFQSSNTYKNLSNVKSNVFIDELKVLLFKVTFEKMMDFEIDLLKFDTATSLHEEEQTLKEYQKRVNKLPKLIKDYENLRESLPESFLKIWDPFSLFYEILARTKENHEYQIKQCENRSSKEYVQKYLMNTVKHYNETTSVDETLVLCHLKWGAAGRDYGEEVNTSEENHRLETVEESNFRQACNDANPNSRYHYSHLYQNLMTAYDHFILPDSKYAVANELFIMIPAELYEMLKTVSKNAADVNSRHRPSRKFQIRAAYSFEITKEKFKNEAFMETLITLHTDNKMNFSETVKTAWNLQN